MSSPPAPHPATPPPSTRSSLLSPSVHQCHPADWSRRPVLSLEPQEQCGSWPGSRFLSSVISCPTITPLTSNYPHMLSPPPPPPPPYSPPPLLPKTSPCPVHNTSSQAPLSLQTVETANHAPLPLWPSHPMHQHGPADQSWGEGVKGGRGGRLSCLLEPQELSGFWSVSGQVQDSCCLSLALPP